MITDHKFRHPEFRKKVTDCILEVLAQLAEADRNIFIWSHYHGYQVELIAEILGRSGGEVETKLGVINSILYQKIGSLLAEDPKVNTESERHDGVTLEKLWFGQLV